MVDLLTKGAKMDLFQKSVKSMNDMKDLQMGRGLFDQSRSQFEKFQSDMAEAERLYDNSVISGMTLARTKLRLLEGIEGPKQYEGLNPLERGSQADRSFGLKLDFDQKQAAKTAQEKIADALNDAKQRDQKRNQLLDDIKRGLAEQPALGVQPI